MSDEMRDALPERPELVDRRAFLQMVAGVATGAAVGCRMPEGASAEKRPALSQTRTSKETATLQRRGGHLYMQTNETGNAVVHYRWSASGMLTEVERVATGGAGSGLLSPIYHTNRPNHFEGAGSVILTPDHRFLFTTNGGDNATS